MKLKNNQIIDFATTDFKDKKLPVRLQYALSMNIAAVEQAVKVYNEQRQELVNKYAKRNENGEILTVDDHYVIDDIAGWNEAMTELMNAYAEVPITTVPISVLEKCDDPMFADLSMDELAAINFMFEDKMNH